MKILKIAVIVALILQFQGCMYQSVNNYDITEAVEKCNGVENIADIRSYFLGEEAVTCRNNTSLTLHE